MFLDYYDLAYGSCNISADIEESLGYKRIFLSGKEIKIIETTQKRGEAENSIVIAESSDKDILAAIKMNPSAIVFGDMRINKRALGQMLENDIVLCIPTSTVTSFYGLQRSRSLYLMSKLFAYAKSIKLDVSFATLAKNNLNLCSYMQLIEIAKLLGASDEYARHSISEVNKSLVRE